MGDFCISRSDGQVQRGGAHVFIQGELSTREYERTIAMPRAKRTQSTTEGDVPLRGTPLYTRMSNLFTDDCEAL
jgi:hypothetical protein